LAGKGKKSAVEEEREVVERNFVRESALSVVNTRGGKAHLPRVQSQDSRGKREWRERKEKARFTSSAGGPDPHLHSLEEGPLLQREKKINWGRAVG